MVSRSRVQDGPKTFALGDYIDENDGEYKYAKNQARFVTRETMLEALDNETRALEVTLERLSGLRRLFLIGEYEPYVIHRPYGCARR